MTNVVLLNTDYTFLGQVTWQKAICLMTKGKVEVIKYTDRIIRNFDGSVVMKIPVVMKLIKYIRTLFRTNVPFSKRNVIIRDGYTCAYCGDTPKRLTIDHVVPKSKGGKSTFENCCSSCKSCNSKKGNKSCQEARMFPKVNLTQPTISEFLRLKFKRLGINDVLKELGIY